MSVMYRRECSECDFQPANVNAGGFRLFITDREEDQRRENGETLPVVLHPLSPAVLDEFGLSYHRAAWGGQLVACETRICRECGQVFEQRRLTTGGVTIGCGGCLLVGACVVVVGAIAAFASGNPFIGSAVGIALGVGLATGAEWSSHWWVRWRYPMRVLAVDTITMCTGCGSRRWTPITAAVREPFPCPQCGQRSQQITPISPE